MGGVYIVDNAIDDNLPGPSGKVVNYTPLLRSTIYHNDSVRSLLLPNNLIRRLSHAAVLAVETLRLPKAGKDPREKMLLAIVIVLQPPLLLYGCLDKPNNESSKPREHAMP